MWVGVSTGIPEIKLSTGLGDLAARIKWRSNQFQEGPCLVTGPGMLLPESRPPDPKCSAQSPLPSFQVSGLRIVLSMVVVWWQRRGFCISHSVSIFPGERSGSRNPEGGSFLQPGSPPWLVTSASTFV